MSKTMHIPIDVVNLICEFAAGSDKLWYPRFCPKTHKVSWKVNKHYVKQSPICYYMFELYNKYVIEGDVRLFNDKLFTEFRGRHKTIVYDYGDTLKLYIEFDSETDPDKQNKFIYRTFTHVHILTDYRYCHSMSGVRDLFLNGTLYGYIDAVALDNTTKAIDIYYDNY
jgi:hypothetical protein